MKLVTVYKFDLDEEEIESLRNVSDMCESFPSEEYAKLPKHLQKALSDIYAGIDTLFGEMVEE